MWFYRKKRKIWKENLYLTENRSSRNEMWCAVGNHNQMRYICAKGLLDSNFKFHDIAPNFTYSPKFVILKVLLETDNPPDYALYILWQGHVKNLLFFF